MSGTFTVFTNPVYIPNTFFDYRVASVDFRVGATRIRHGTPPPPLLSPGDPPYSGALSATTFGAGVSASMWLLIDGQPAALTGGGELSDLDTLPPTFTALELCGLPADRYVSCAEIRDGVEPGYILTLSAMPIE